jgi:flagellar biosynthesis protein FlhF
MQVEADGGQPMKMQRYHARDMRQALARIRAEQGPDAVILSTQRTAEGVVVCAAVDFDFSEPPAAVALAADVASVQPLPDVDDEVVALGGRPPACAEPAIEAGPAIMGERVGAEIRSLRRLLETQVAMLAWNDYTRRQPLKSRVLEDLGSIGLARDLALEIVAELPDDIDAEQAARLPLAQLTRRIQTTKSAALEHGGVLALVGPNGVGKTTTLAKFATRWVLERGNRDVALVSTDCERFGAQEQLQALGRVLGVPALAVDGPEALRGALESLRDRRLVLLDTPGLNPRSERISQELGALGSAGSGIEIALVVAGSTQAGALEESVARFGTLRPSHCVLTRLDEATSLGGTLSTLVHAGLPVSWLCEGPRVPQDIEVARAHQLIARAVTLARRSGASVDEDLLARRFGGSLNAST